MVLFFQVSRTLFCFYIVNVSCHLFLDFQCHLFQDCQLSPIKLPGSTRRPHLTGGEGRAQHRQLDISIVLQGARKHQYCTRCNKSYHKVQQKIRLFKYHDLERNIFQFCASISQYCSTQARCSWSSL